MLGFGVWSGFLRKGVGRWRAVGWGILPMQPVTGKFWHIPSEKQNSALKISCYRTHLCRVLPTPESW